MLPDLISEPGDFIKKQKIVNQFLKYSVVGAANTLITLGTIFFFYNVLHTGYIAANLFGYFLGLINSFIWNKKWTFRSAGSYKNEVLPFAVIFLISYLANLGTVIIMSEIFKINPNISQAAGNIIYTLINFFLNKRWTFS